MLREHTDGAAVADMHMVADNDRLQKLPGIV